MLLEDIAKTYGMNDYYDMNTGRTYCLSRAIDFGSYYYVPVMSGGCELGVARMEKGNNESTKIH